MYNNTAAARGEASAPMANELITFSQRKFTIIGLYEWRRALLGDIFIAGFSAAAGIVARCTVARYMYKHEHNRLCVPLASSFDKKSRRVTLTHWLSEKSVRINWRAASC